MKKIIVSLIIFLITAGTVSAGLPAEIEGLAEKIEIETLISRMADNRFILLGEASHGTEEFYEWRRLLSRKLIEKGKISYIVVEGDWQAIYSLNEYVKGRSEAESARELVAQFDRWPTWMWANRQVEKFAEWLKKHNSERDEKEKVGFYGFDIYGWDDSLNWFLENYDLDSEPAVEAAIDCLIQFEDDGFRYTRSYQRGEHDCKVEVENFYEKTARDTHEDKQEFLVHQHASVIKYAEKFYRTQVYGGARGWNARVRHMTNTTLRLDRNSPRAGIVWAHNTHMGDARATAMAMAGRENTGQHLKQQYDDETFILGFGTGTGRVLAGSSWGVPGEIMQIPMPQPDSVEDYLLEKESSPLLIFTGQLSHEHPLVQPRGHRAIGVVYNPAQEQGNFVPTLLNRRYDAFLFFAATNPLQPVN